MNEQTKQQLIALGRLGWSLRRIEKTTGVRRETVAAYLRAAGVLVRPPGLWGHRSAVAAQPPATASGADAGPPPAKPAIEVTTDFGAELAASPDSCEAPPDADGTIAAMPAVVSTAVVADPAHAKPAIRPLVSSASLHNSLHFGGVFGGVFTRSCNFAWMDGCVWISPLASRRAGTDGVPHSSAETTESLPGHPYPDSGSCSSTCRLNHITPAKLSNVPVQILHGLDVQLRFLHTTASRP